MMNASEFIGDFLAHQYDPVKAHEYYMRVRKLKGRAGVAKDAKAQEYVNNVTNDAHQKLLKDLKGQKVRMNPRRRISAAEQKLIRAKSLAARVKDPQVRSDMLAKIADAEKKLHVLKQTHGMAKQAVAHPVLKKNVSKQASPPKKATSGAAPVKKAPVGGKDWRSKIAAN